MNLVTFKENLIKKNKHIKKLKSKKNIFLEENYSVDPKKYNAGNKIEINRKKDYFKYICRIYEIILENLTVALNKSHKQNFSKKYWELLISRWLWIYIAYIYSAWEIIRIVEKKNKIKSTILLSLNSKNFIPSSTLHFHNMAMKNEYWSSWVFNKIINYKKRKNLVYVEPNNNNIRKNLNLLDEKVPVYKIFNFIFKPKKFFFYKFQLPKKIKIKFFLSKCYFIFKKIKYVQNLKNENNKSLRDEFYNFKNSDDDFINFLNKFLKNNFPRIFLEDYSRLENSYLKLNWPTKPKYIFTSYGFYYDEIFKIYASKLRENDYTKLIIGQHGGSSGMEDNSLETFFETKISDRYLTWGWKENKKHYPLFATTVEDIKKKFFFNKKNKIILVLHNLTLSPIRPSLNSGVATSDVNKIYIKLVVDFMKYLNCDIKHKVEANIKGGADLLKNSFIRSSILSEHSKLKFIKNNKFTHEVRNKYNLQVEFYLSTGFLEAMLLNNPVILIYNKLIRRQKKEVLNQIQLLIKKNICFTDSKKASEFVNNNYGSIDKWWNDPAVQRTRKLFCEKYCKKSENPIKDLNKSLVF